MLDGDGGKPEGAHEGMLGPVGRMLHAGNIDEAAGRVGDALVGGREAEVEGRDPGHEGTRGHALAGAVAADPGANGKQRVALAELLAPAVQHQPFAQSGAGKDDPFRGDPVDKLQHDLGSGRKMRPAPARHLREFGQAVGAHPGQHAAKLARLAGRHRILVDDLQRVAAVAEVEPGPGPPGPADAIEAARRVRRLQPAGAVEAGGDMPGEVLAVFDIRKTQHAQRKAVALGGAQAGDPHQFEAAAAEIGDNAGRVGDCAQNPPRARKGFLGAAQDVDLPPADPFEMAGEFGAVAGVPDRRRRIGLEPVHLKQGRDVDEPLERLLREPASLRVQLAGPVEVGAELAGGLVVEERTEAVRPVAIDHQPHRIGADIDNADPSGGPRLLQHAVRLPG